MRELSQPLGRTLHLLACRLDALLLEGQPGDAYEELRRVRLLTTDAIHSLREVTEILDFVPRRGPIPGLRAAGPR